METHHKTEQTPQEQYRRIIQELANGYKPLAKFQNKETRDTVAKLLKANGFIFRKTSISGQELHPEYISDFVGTYQTGFGNTDYKTFFKKLYKIEDIKGL